jgi:hypothetical protein
MPLVNDVIGEAVCRNAIFAFMAVASSIRDR